MKVHLGKAEPVAMLALSMLACHDEESARHCRRVAEIALQIACRYRPGWTDDDLRSLYLGALLHDLGKVKIDQRILRKPAALDNDEWALMKTHPVVGAILAASHPQLECAVPIIRHHHESWDGKGYPGGLRTADIPLGARIVAVADAYDALTHDRPYREAFEHLTAVHTIRSSAGIQFDSCVFHALEVLKESELNHAV